ncbi:hypothetical protein PPYR_13563 [Photinus pyralis]|uniref:EKC/KEOPS complex subunit CGI121 n=1 Tax=Photinus pyralis TaxID=7054 RepID=A0A5N4A9F0_PHOPY|nr:EKC/KEOPS complex subunit TPRKB-like [Photinus pyralis]KAB0793943.1 hypothetical protein PPYR_13563 [Photinus pyralis]
MTYSLELGDNSTIKMKLYRNVKNVAELRQKILNRTLDCCITKPSLIVDPFQVVVAANKAVVAEKLTTKSIYSEILFNLSISKNITQSLQKFGIDDKEREILVVVVERPNDGNDCEVVFRQIDGEEIDVSRLEELANLQEIKKVYKLSDLEFEHLPMLNSVVSRIAGKEFL